MMSLSTIRSESLRAARRSAAEGRGPLVIEPSDLDHLDQAVRGVPFLGDRTPRGYKKLSTHNMEGLLNFPYPYEELFVDLSGWGSPSEPALTQEQFISAVRVLVERYGAVALALSEIGQFQGHVRVMIPTATKAK